MDRLSDRFRFLLRHGMPRTCDSSKLSMFRSTCQIHLEVVPGFVHLVTLMLREAREGAAWRQICPFKYNHGYIVVPYQPLLWE